MNFFGRGGNTLGTVFFNFRLKHLQIFNETGVYVGLFVFLGGGLCLKSEWFQPDLVLFDFLRNQNKSFLK